MTEIDIFLRIDETTDDSVRAYAFIGLCVSLVSEIEHKLFHCFNHILRGDRTANAKRFYKGLGLARRWKLADEAVRGMIQNEHALSTWAHLINETERLCGSDSIRNIVAHHPLRRHIHIRTHPDGSPEMVDGSAIYAELAVQLDRNVVLAGRRPVAKHTPSDLRQYAAELLHLYHGLYDFDDKYLRPPFLADPN
ncbi:hypothetical protein ACFOGJ_02780 [Marinibaculum pumilum]|uniref:DUF3800 domain-containing protein n=1 Tax=Marinibaculum pumilum TaxID=1766165 RepID=A0ABV7KV49_9PROT